MSPVVERMGVVADGAEASSLSWAPSDRQPPGARIHVIRSAADLDDLPHLTDEDKAIARDYIKFHEEHFGFPLTNPIGMRLNDPKFEVAYNQEFHTTIQMLCAELQEDPSNGTYVRQGTIMNLIFLSVAQHFHWTWGVQAIAMVAPLVDGFNAEQVFMMDFPEAEIWDDEQRFALIFTKAVITYNVTDELMAQALEMWGPKLTIRYMGLMGSVVLQSMFANAFNVAGRWNDAPGSEGELAQIVNANIKPTPNIPSELRK